MTHSRNCSPAVKSASGAGTREQVQWEMGSWVGRTGGGSDNRCQGSITTLGEGAQGLLTTLGEGAPLKSGRWGVAWKQGGTGAGNESVEAAGLGGGLQEGTSDRGRPGVGSNGELSLGGSWGGTPGRAGSGERMGRKASGARRRHDSKISQRLAITSIWKIIVGGAAPARALATT